MHKTYINKTRTLSFLLTIALLSGLITPGLSVKAACVEHEVIEGSELVWSLDADGVLTIEGPGPLPDQGIEYPDGGSGLGTTKAPWADYREEITSIVITESVTGIGDYAFTGCSKVTSVSIAEGVEFIGEGAFAETGITQLNLPQSITDVEAYAFYSCMDLETAVLPNNLKEIDMATFGFCKELTDITLPTSLEEIGSDAFLWCAFSNIQIPDSVSYIGMGAFTACTNLQAVTLPANLESISMSLFMNCLSLVEIRVPEKVREIASDAFRDTSSNLKIYAPAGSYTATDWAAENTDYTVIVEDNQGSDTLAAPTNFKATYTENGVQLSWSLYPDTSVDTYIIQRKQDEGAYQTVFNGEALEMTDYLDTAALESGTYTYELKVSNGSKMSEPATAEVIIPIEDTESPQIGDMSPAAGSQIANKTTLQVAASDNCGLQKAVFSYRAESSSDWTLIGTDEITSGEEITSHTFSYDWILPETLEGTVIIKAEVYDTFDANAPAEFQRTVTAVKYIAPVAPVVQAQNDYLKANISWTYEKAPSAFLKHFVIYKTDENGANQVKIAEVKRALSASYTVSLAEGEAAYIVVEAVDYFGETGVSAPVAVASTDDTIAPEAILKTETKLAIAGRETLFSAADSTDNTGIVSYSWDFDGDGEIDIQGANEAEVSYTYTEAGTYTVTLTTADAAGNQDTASLELTVCEISGEDGEYAFVTITVKNAFDEALAAVNNAQLQLICEDEDGNITFQTEALTDEQGEASFPAPVGTATLLVAAEGFMSQKRSMTVEADNQGQFFYSLGLAPADASFVSGELKVSEMTIEEIEQAGIDTSDPSNQHVWKHETTMTFVVAPGVPGMEITPVNYINTLGEIIATENNWFQIPYNTEDDGSGEGGTDPGDNNNGTDFGYMNVGVFPISENFVMVVYGEAHWLKEMFRVELLVANNSYMYDITDCLATLNLPEGLSLAAMAGEEQTLEIDMGNIGYKGSAEGSSKKASWYICGDEEGVYALSASVSGLLGSMPFENTFTANEAIKVYAGSALNLKVKADNVTFWGEDYHIRYELTNVSDKTLYNMAFSVNGLELTQNIQLVKMGEQMQIIEGTRTLEKEDFAAEKQISFDELNPGDTLVVDMFCKPLFLSMAQWVDLGPVEAAYYLADMFTTTMEGSSTEIPTTVEMVPVTHGTLKEWMQDQITDEVGDTAINVFTELMDLGEIPFVDTAVKIYEFAKTGNEILNTEPTLVITLNKDKGSFARMGVRTLNTNNSGVITVYTDAPNGSYVVEEQGENMVMTITGDAKVYVQGNNPGSADVTFTTWAAPHVYTLNQDTGIMEMTTGKHDLTYTATFTVPDGSDDGTHEECFEMSSTNVVMGNTMDMLFAFKKAEKTDWTGYYAEMVRSYADGRREEKLIVHSEDWTSNGNFYTVTYDGLKPKEMCDTVTITVYDKEGNPVSDSMSESIQSYSMRMLESIECAKQKTMLVDMLNYGAAAQKEFDYAVNNLANAALTAAQKALATAEMKPVESITHGEKWTTGTLNLEDNLKFTICLSELEAGQYVRVNYVGHKGNHETVRVEGKTDILIENLVAADARSSITITICNADGTEASVVKDSVASAVGRSNGNELLKAYLKFADSAYTYLHNQE